MRAALSIILFVLVYSCSPNQSNPVNKAVKSDRFKIHTFTQQGTDNVIEYNYFLIDNDSKDSIKLLTALRHDLPPPNYFWTKDQKLLIYEQGDYGNEESTIKLFNPITKKTTYETNGFFQGISNNTFLDKKNNILFYFTSTHKNISIKKIDLSNNNESVIYEFQCIEMLERPTLNINPLERILSYSYSCQESTKEKMTSENGETKY